MANVGSRRAFAWLWIAAPMTVLSLGDAGAQTPVHPIAPGPIAPQPVKPQPIAVNTWPTWTGQVLTAFRQAVSTWTATTGMNGVVINGPTATAGRLNGPPLQPTLRAAIPTTVPADVANAFASGLSSAWASWSTSVTLGGLPLYPAFAGFPGPAAPPTPSVPVPLGSLVMVNSSLSPLVLTATLSAALGNRMNDVGAASAISQFAQTIATQFGPFRGACTVTNIIGMGPVPSYAPPSSLVGPVLGGSGTMAPGGLTCVPWPMQ